MFANWWKSKPRLKQYPDTYMTRREALFAKLALWTPQSQSTAEATVGSTLSANVVLLLAHFPSTFDRLEKELNHRQRPYQVVPHTITGNWLQKQAAASLNHPSRPVPLILGLAQQLELLPDPPTALAPDPWSLATLVAERHFLNRRDQHILDFLSSIVADRQVGFFLAMDDPILQALPNPALHLIMEHHGMQDDSVFGSHLVDRQVRINQRQFQRRALEDRFVESPEQWLKEHVARRS